MKILAHSFRCGKSTFKRAACSPRQEKPGLNSSFAPKTRFSQEGGEAGLAGSLSYSGGPGHCRVATDSAPFVRRTDLEILTAATPAAFSWVHVHSSKRHTDLPAGAVQTGRADGEPTFICRVPQQEGTPGHVYEAGLTGGVSYTRGEGECRVVTGSDAYYVAQDFQVMVGSSS